MNKDIKKILLVLAVFALSGGIFYNFQELWMAENNLSTQTIGTVYSLCALLSVSTIFLCSNIITKEKIKKLTLAFLFLKFIILLFLFLLNNTGLNVLIKFLIMLDYVLDVEIYVLIYPLITLITKNDKIYAMRGLVYSFAYYGGVVIISILLGRHIGNFIFDYNFYNLMGSLLILVAFFVLKSVNMDKYCHKEESKSNNNYDALYRVVKTVRFDKISMCYLLYVLTKGISYICINALFITLLTNNLGFAASSASIFKLVLGIVAVLVGALILEKLTLKNNYINFLIKYGGRLLLFIMAFIMNNKAMFLIAIIYARLLAESYTHITDAPYINRFSNDEQLAFSNFREMVEYLSKSIGSLICGFALTYGIKFNFLFASIFLVLGIYFGLKAMKFYNKEKNNDR